MYQAGTFRCINKIDLSFYSFVNMPLYSTTNELRKAIVEQKKLLTKLEEKRTPETEKVIENLQEKLLKSTAILTDPLKRDRYLHFLKIRAYINQLSNLDKINSVQQGRVFPWMIFKIIYNKSCHILEIDVLNGTIKIVCISDQKVVAFIRAPELNGSFELFEENVIIINHVGTKGLQELRFTPFYLSHQSTILKFLEFLEDFERVFLFNRRGIEFGASKERGPTMDLSMYDGFLPFEDDRILPIKSGFNEGAEAIPSGQKVRLLVGSKHLVVAKGEHSEHIIHLFAITANYPKINIREGVIDINEEGSDTYSLRFDNNSKGPLCVKIIGEFQKPNFEFQFDLNIFPTILYPDSFEEAIKLHLRSRTRRSKEDRPADEDSSEDEEDDDQNSSDFDGYDL